MREREYEPDDLDEADDWLANEDEDDGDDGHVVACPSCGADVYEDAEQCPSCGDYIVQSTSPWLGKPWWWVVLGVLGIGAVVRLMIPFE